MQRILLNTVESIKRLLEFEYEMFIDFVVDDDSIIVESNGKGGSYNDLSKR